MGAPFGGGATSLNTITMMTWAQIRLDDSGSPLIEELCFFHDFITTAVIFIFVGAGCVLIPKLYHWLAYWSLGEPRIIRCVAAMTPTCKFMKGALLLPILLSHIIRLNDSGLRHSDFNSTYLASGIPPLGHDLPAPGRLAVQEWVSTVESPGRVPDLRSFSYSNRVNTPEPLIRSQRAPTLFHQAPRLILPELAHIWQTPGFNLNASQGSELSETDSQNWYRYILDQHPSTLRRVLDSQYLSRASLEEALCIEEWCGSHPEFPVRRTYSRFEELAEESVVEDLVLGRPLGLSFFNTARRPASPLSLPGDLQSGVAISVPSSFNQLRPANRLESVESRFSNQASMSRSHSSVNTRMSSLSLNPPLR